MPLVPRYTWEEDSNSLALELHLPGIAPRNIDIYVSDLVIKVNATPYVLLLDLQDAVDDASVVVQSIPTSNQLRISLKKVESRMWKNLQFQGSKSVLRERRDASMERRRASEMAFSEKRKEKRHQVERETLRAQMAVDDTNRQILSDLKAEEKDREERSLYESFRELQSQTQQQKEREIQRTEDQSVVTESSMADKIDEDSKTSSNHLQSKVSFVLPPKDSDNKVKEEIIELTDDGCFDISSSTKQFKSFHESIVATTAKDSNNAESRNSNENSRNEAIEVIASDITSEQQDKLNLPPPRQCITSEIRFTPRVFPTPTRESKAAEEENWLLKNRKHIKQHQGLHRSSDYDISETDPMWLKAKGDDFFHTKDFRSAINAYGESILAVSNDNTEFLATCLSNRAACLLQLGEFEECITDCSKALTYLPDTRDKNDNMKNYRLKLKLFVRRGTAYCRSGQYSQAKADYGVACSMDTQNSQLHDDFMELIAMEKAQEFKQIGDTIFREGKNLANAIQMYSESLQLNPLSIACLSNRAACYLMQHCAKECISDCTNALELLQEDVTSLGQEQGHAFFLNGPAAGSSQRRSWVVKTLVRRGVAYLSLRDLDKAEQDFAASVELDPSNEALKADLARVQSEKKQNESQCDHAFLPLAPLQV
ncbi:FOG: TPR repeat [Plasmopara halstedii]|uniref:FOG: TPR repeat n=1 Tax=Plasmopara halstedii TaxID=4781 RepID=A0A0P1B3V7_PLAHL|nr:FOG: TPR repeat [Plasmopara halstedii]CEG48580.1 FOG: TPR repeat [Plasmopara halstedii]|eukprot:XP_024584949.1 FOG: TPR repeat [Plasmopara halstedii]